MEQTWRQRLKWRVCVRHPNGEVKEAEEKSELKIQTWDINLGIFGLLVVFKTIKVDENT